MGGQEGIKQISGEGNTENSSNTDGSVSFKWGSLFFPLFSNITNEQVYPGPYPCNNSHFIPDLPRVSQNDL